MVASLLGPPFRLTLGEVADLTDRQIHELYFHPRDERGNVRVPEPLTDIAGADPAQAEAALAEILSAFGLPAEKLRELKRRRLERERDTGREAAGPA